MTGCLHHLLCLLLASGQKKCGTQNSNFLSFDFPHLKAKSSRLHCNAAHGLVQRSERAKRVEKNRHL